MIAIIDYGVGNLFSLQSSLAAIEQNVIVTANLNEIHNADKIILPGVGAFRDAIGKLCETGLSEIVKDEAASGKPLLGICLGMQLLFEKSYEYGEYDGLALIPGAIRPIRDVIPADYKIPHIGWNSLVLKNPSVILRDIKEGDCMYFVHSYYAANCNDYVTAETEYGAYLTASVQNGRIYGCQFHPEKSGKAGLSILRAFCEEG